MSGTNYERATALQASIANEAQGLLGRSIGSMVRYDRSQAEWIVNLIVSRKISEAEANALTEIGAHNGIRVEWIDDMQPARLAVG